MDRAPRPRVEWHKVIAIFEELKHGSSETGPLYRRCVRLWVDVLHDANHIRAEDLAERLSELQPLIEAECDGALGKAIMAVSGFSYLCNEHTGFEDNKGIAEKLLRAFELSYVSSEVKVWAKDAAMIFRV